MASRRGPWKRIIGGLAAMLCGLIPNAIAQDTPAPIPDGREDAATMAPSVIAVWGPLELRPSSRRPMRRRSILQHASKTSSTTSHRPGAASSRAANGAGLHAEYTPFQEQYSGHGDPTRVAQFGNVGGVPNRMEQIEAQKVGILSNYSLQQHIDNYARPQFFYGFGFGGIGGFY